MKDEFLIIAGDSLLIASMRKFQEQNEAHQASRAKMAEGMALALEKKDQVTELEQLGCWESVEIWVHDLDVLSRCHH